jgi:hypothetical protein
MGPVLAGPIASIRRRTLTDDPDCASQDGIQVGFGAIARR